MLDREMAETVVENQDVKRLLTIAGVNAIAAAGLVAAIGDVQRFSSPQKLVSHFGLNPRVRQSGLGLAQHGRISKIGRAHARAMLVEAAPPPAAAGGPCRDGSSALRSMGGCQSPRPAARPDRLCRSVLRIRARRGHQVAAVATARKMAVLVWHLLTKEADYLWARPALVAHKLRSLELQTGRPMKKGNKRGSAYAYNVKEPCCREKVVAEQAEQAYERLVATWRNRAPGRRRTGAASAAGPS